MQDSLYIETTRLYREMEGRDWRAGREGLGGEGRRVEVSTIRYLRYITRLAEATL